MSRTLRTLIISLAVLLSCGAACSQTPDWVKEFRREVYRTEHLAGQRSLQTLLKTRRGNCVAYAKLFASLAMKHGLACESVSIGPRGGESEHRIALVRDERGHLWSSSNNEAYRVDNDQNALEEAIDRLGGGNSIDRAFPSSVSWSGQHQAPSMSNIVGAASSGEFDDWVIIHRHFFTKEELD